MENEQNEVFEIIGKIEEVSEKPKTSGGVFKKVKIQGRTFNVFDDKLFDFLHIDNIIAAKYNETKKGDFTYKNIFFITRATEEDIVKEANKVPMQSTQTKVTKEVDWDGKDRRIVKQNVLNRSVDMYIAGKINKEDILKTADTFLDWVYDKFPKVDKIKSIDEIEEIDLSEETVE